MHTVIVANAPNANLGPFRDLIRDADLVIAADGGANTLAALGLDPDLVIGDFDSLDPGHEAVLGARGTRLLRFPAEKDETDLELALLRAVAEGATTIDVLGALGGRWDQSLANLMMLALPELAACRVRLLSGHETIALVRERLVIAGEVGETVSLLPIGGPVEGITTSGLYYPLAEATLSFERSRGVSNLLTAPQAEIRLRRGLLLVIHQQHPKEERYGIPDLR